MNLRLRIRPEILTAAADTDQAPPSEWEAVVILEGVRTGDGREIALGALTPREMPLPLLHQTITAPEHDGSVVVGTIDTLDRVEVGDGAAEWRATGRFDLDSPSGMEAARLVARQILRWLSADLEVIEYEELQDGAACDDDPFDPACAWIFRVVRGRIMGATLIAFPAFPQAVIVPAGAEIPAATDAGRPGVAPVTAAVIGALDLPVAAREHPWDGPEARRRVFALCTSDDGDVDVACVSRAFLWRDPDANPETQGAYSLGFADVIDGELRIVPRGVAATAGGRGVDAAAIPEADRERIRTRICSLYDRIRDTHDDWPDCPFDRGDASAEGVGLVAHADGWRPPSAWFADPALGAPTPLTITDEGRVWGHAATWDACHAGYPAACLPPPRCTADYASFLLASPPTSDGVQVRSGPITLGGGHCNDLLASAEEARRHYDTTSAAVADVTVGEDAHGIWVAGAIRPGVTPEQLYALRGSTLSGDWRPGPGGPELIALHAVNTPGFRIPRRAHLRTGAVDAMIASGLPPALVADADTVRTGAMIALVPTPEDAERFALPGGLDPGDLHLTLAFLGDTHDPEITIDEAAEVVRDTLDAHPGPLGPLAADAWAYAVFNPTRADRSPALVALVQSDAIQELRSAVWDLDVSEYATWVPHITLAYDPDDCPRDLMTDRMGEIRFDRIRVAYGPTHIDIPLPSTATPATEPSRVRIAAALNASAARRFRDRALSH